MICNENRSIDIRSDIETSSIPYNPDHSFIIIIFLAGN